MKKLAVILLSTVMLTPAFGQTTPIKLYLDEMDMHKWQGCRDFTVNTGPLSASITRLIGSGNFSVSIDPASGFGVVRICVRATSYIPGDPPGAPNLKIAEVTVKARPNPELPPQEIFRCDVVIDNPYYARAQKGNVGGQAGGEFLLWSWPIYPNGGYVPLELTEAEPAPGYEFVGWVGDPVDRGYIQDPTSPLLKITPYYHIEVGKQFFLKALFGVPVAPGDTTVALPGTPVTLGFSEVTTAGHTMLTQSPTGPGVPTKFRLGIPPRYYDITTTATWSGQISVCIDYSGMSFTGSPESLHLLHYEGGEWVDCTTSVDTGAQVICGAVDSLSPFVVVEPVTIPVEIDIKPGNSPNSVNINAHGVIPVAILGNAGFDVTRIDPFSLSIEGMAVQIKKNGTAQCSIEDVNADGFADLVCQFADNGTMPQGTVSATLTGNLKPEYGATPIEGSDEIRLVP